MSQIENVITTTFRATGGNVVSQLNSYASGFGRVGQAINQNTEMSSRLNNQWRAIGTTIRYAIAGTAIFGLQRMVSDLSAVNTQLGQMQALTAIGQGTQFSDTQMGQLLTGLMDTSQQTVTPLSDVNDASINFLSTVQNVKASQLPQMLTDIGIAAKISQASMEDVTQAATTMQIAFGRKVDPTSVGQFSRMFQWLIGVVPGGTGAGTTIAQAMPGLASMFQLAPGKQTDPATRQAQMMALTQGVLMTGMPAATGMRGLTYLLQSIAQPTGKAKDALAGIGITSTSVSQKGIFSSVMQLLHHISPVSKTEQQRLAAIPDATLDETNTLPGIPASELTKLRTMIPRIHGIRAAIILASQLQQRGDVQSIAQDLNDYTKVQSTNSEQAKKVAAAAADFRRNAKMQDAAVALHNAGIEIARGFNPLFNIASGDIIGASGFLQKHQRGTTDVARAGVGFLAAMGVARFARVPLPGILGKFSGAGGNAFVKGRAIESAMAGSTIMGASPQNPMYVVVVGQLFGGANPLTDPVPNKGGGGVFGFVKKIAGAAGVGALARWGDRIPGLLGKGAAGLEGLGAEIPGIVDLPMWWPGKMNPNTHRRNPGWENLLSLNLINRHGMNDHISRLQRAQKFFPNATGIESFLRGAADVNLTIDITDPNTGRRTREKVHVPVGLWSGGKHPSHRGRAGKTVRTK
jgi:hypothetical protein